VRGSASKFGLALAISVLALAALATGCKDSSAPPAATGFRVALLTPGSIRDGGWNQSAYEGLERIRDELGAEIAHQEAKTPQDFESGFRDFAARGFNLVFGHGFEFQDAAALVSKEYPHTIFITTSGSTIRSNVAPIVFELEEATYVLGFLGARMSARSNKLGEIGGVKIPSVESTFTAFEAGARRGRRHAEVTTSYIGSWTDVSAAREATLAQIASGVDVLIHNANEAAAGFFQAVNDSPNVWAFGTNKNQNDRAPEHVLASATLDVPRALLIVAQEVKSGSWNARSMRFGLSSGVVKIEWNEALREKIPAELQAEVEKLQADVASGSVSVPRGSF
jgi:basic membrane lipoprotein Med (substrate-binding protein (PBP1-ABC) superfamily)